MTHWICLTVTVDIIWARDTLSQWLISFNTSKSKLITTVQTQNLQQSWWVVISSQRCSLFLTPTGSKTRTRPQLEGVCSCHCKRSRKNSRSIVSPQKMTPSARVYIYKSPRLENYCHIWSGAAQSSLPSLDTVQKRSSGLMRDDLFLTLIQQTKRRQPFTTNRWLIAIAMADVRSNYMP